MKRMAVTMAVLLACATGANAAQFSGEIGCGLIWTQQKRLRLADVIARSSQLKAVGLDTQQSNQAQSEAAKDLVDLTKAGCKEVSGDYKVLERRPVSGGYAVRIAPSKTESLWVLE